MRAGAGAAPGSPALILDDEHLDYRELDRLADAMGERLVAGGVAPGQWVTLAVSRDVRGVVRLLGLWRAGAVPVALPSGLAPPELAAAQALIGPVWHLDIAGLRGLGSPREQDPGTADVTVSLMTSGTTGRPSAVALSRSALAASADAVSRRLSLGPDDRWGLALSPGHIGGMALLVRAIRNGSSVRIWSAFDPDRIARDILSGAVTHLSVVPVMLQRILDSPVLATALARAAPPPTLRCIVVGGAAAPGALLRRAWDAGLPLATTWGMTETASQIATAPPGEACRFPGTAGRPLRGLQVRPGADGTLQVRGPTLASIIVEPGRDGQVGRPAPLPTDRQGWFQTRDIGRIDEEGRVWVEGRVDDMIISGGLNVSAVQVERVIRAHPGVADAVVFGVPDPEWGSVVAAVVESADPGVTADAVDRHCRARLSRGRCPSRIVVTDALSRTSTGKVIRHPMAHGL